MRQEPERQEPDKSTFDAGDLVDALWTDDGGWYPAKVVSRNPDGSYEVEWEDGSESGRVKAADEVHPRDGENLSVRACAFIESIVAKVQDVLDTHATVPPEEYTSDSKYRSLVSEMLDSKAHAIACLRYALEDLQCGFDYVASLGLRRGYCKYLGFLQRCIQDQERCVEALWRDNGQWYPAKMVSRNPDGGYEVEWEDGNQKDRFKTADEVRPHNKEALVRLALRLCMAMRLVRGDVDEQDAFGMTRLMIAAMDGEGARAVRNLVSAAADVNAVNAHSGKTPLGLAAEFGHAEVVRLLVELQADLNATPDAPPAVAAAFEGHADVVKVLAELRADVHGGDYAGNTPIFFAVRYEYPELARVLLAADLDVNAPMPSGRHVLYEAGASFWNSGLEPGQLARSKTVKLLLEAKASVDAARPSVDEEGPMSQALRDAFDAIQSGLVENEEEEEN